MAEGGYRAPRKPAPVSGPGALSRRTDGPGQPTASLANAQYGEQKDFQNIQGGAKMAAAADLASMITPLNAPTQRPTEPVTSGAPAGPGPGSQVLGIPTPVDQRVADFQRLSKYLPLMEMYAQSPASSGTLKQFMRYLRSQTP